ncbi:MAG: YebC/PmpR family DNA-binding transcriptional regulator [Candidatus Pacebacteria bacterium]|jgi:YebC/PmpR family DNA-binding regulatory protein|nr:YebC/PmpR family DNA-binding transcriptional regulator [Candidatus Paceibacterota bacterium]
MAGHSHWAQIKRKKALLDAKKSQLIGKIINAITVAAREGNNPETNPKLRNAIERAKEFKVPLENIERAIKKAEDKSLNLEEVWYEAYFENVSLLIKAITDNKNRTLGNIKAILNKKGGKLANPGSVRWSFEEKGVVEIYKKNENDVLEFLDIIEDIREKDSETLMLITSVKNLNELKNRILNKGIEIFDSYIEFFPINLVEIKDEETKEKLKNLINELLDLDDVDEVFTSAENLDF